MNPPDGKVRELDSPPPGLEIPDVDNSPAPPAPKVVELEEIKVTDIDNKE